MSYYVGIDVGGQTIKGGVVDASGKPKGEITIVPTESANGNEHFLGQVCKCIRDSVSHASLTMADIASIGVATPGLMDIASGLLTYPVNLPGISNVPIRDHVRKTFNIKTAFQNDANAAAFGEYWAGAGTTLHKETDVNARSLVLFTLGTGIGCGIVWGGKIIEGANSVGAEVGHIIVEMNSDRKCGCGRLGHLEAYSSETALKAMMSEVVATCSSPESRLRYWVKKLGNRAEALFRAAVEYDPEAEQILHECCYALAVGATNMLHTIDPRMVLIGGGMAEAAKKAGYPLIERIQGFVRELAFPACYAKTQIEYAALEEKAGYIGAAGWGKEWNAGQ